MTYTIHDLEPMTRFLRTYALQEYFIPLENLKSFVLEMLKIFKNYKVNVINVSIRHALQDDPRLLLSWAPNSEVFAIVIYYSQLTTISAQREVGKWTRDLVDLAVIKNNGTYYLPYQLHATKEQFYKAYTRINQWLELKKRLDPENIFRNIFWLKYGRNLFHNNHEPVFPL
jgi:FAD/FMN-containing dehydrogenase